MATDYYIAGRSGTSFTDATIHADRDCSDLADASGGVRPLATSTVESIEDPEYCGCVPLDGGGENATGDSEDAEGSDDGDVDFSEVRVAEAVESGVCPWCPEDDRYEGEHVGRHASSAHADEWAEYREGREE